MASLDERMCIHNIGNSNNHAAPDEEEESVLQKTACAACHRRKIKCDRLPGACTACRKLNVPCTYSAAALPRPDSQNRHKQPRKQRGPYQKHKTAREKELEHTVGFLQSRYEELEAQVQKLQLSEPPTISQKPNVIPPSKNGSLSREALVVQQPEVASAETTKANRHPRPSQILDLWYIFKERFDPVTKLIHWPSLERQIRDHIDNADLWGRSYEILMFSIYYCALGVAEPCRVVVYFGDTKENLLSLYRDLLDQAFLRPGILEHPDLPTLQALALHLVFLSRTQGLKNLRESHLGLAMQIVSKLGLGHDEHPDESSQLEVELRRRCWWTLCWIAKPIAGDFQTKKLSVAQWSNVALPRNLNEIDIDFGEDRTRPLVARQGVTDMSFALITFEIAKLLSHLHRMESDSETFNPGYLSSVKGDQDILEQCRLRIESQILCYCDSSRPMDWLLMLYAKALTAKVDILILDQVKAMGVNVPSESNFEDTLTTLCLDLLECHEIIKTDPKLARWRWYFEHIPQPYAIRRVLEDLLARPHAAVSYRAWAVLYSLGEGGRSFYSNDPDSTEAIVLTSLYQKALQAKCIARTNAGNGAGTSSSTSGSRSTEHQELQTPPREPWKFHNDVAKLQIVEGDFNNAFWQALNNGVLESYNMVFDGSATGPPGTNSAGGA